jgi:hypothetical protein
MKMVVIPLADEVVGPLDKLRPYPCLTRTGAKG